MEARVSESELEKKYGSDAIARLEWLYPRGAADGLELLDSLDQNFAKLWTDFVAGMGRRTVLDARTRHLTRVSQLAMLKAEALLEEAVRAALLEPLVPREVLEVILQCSIYGGEVVLDPAVKVFGRVAANLKLADALSVDQLPLDGCDKDRSYEQEAKTWHRDDIADPRFDHLMQRYGWLAVGRGLSLRPKHHLPVLAWHDGLDPDWAGLWVRFVYQGMYSRGIVDDRTRLLCMVGNCVAVNEGEQGRAHMKGALRAGASPREIMEVILQSAVNIGMPSMVTGLRLFLTVLKEEGRLAEVGDPPER